MLRRSFNTFFNSLATRATKPTKLVRYHSFDHDGCIGMPFLEPQEIPAMHCDLLGQLAETQVKAPALEYMMIFSNRQSIRRDCANARYNDNNLALQIIPLVAKHYKAHFDSLLLADIALKQKPGSTHCQLHSLAQKHQLNLTGKLNRQELALLANEAAYDYVYSTDKINILYAQTHRAACIFPHAHIEFNVYDDLVNEVLSPCYQFYQHYAELLPAQVKVNFICYNTIVERLPKPELVYCLKGEGKTDFLYYQTIKRMEEQAYAEEGKERAEYSFSKYLSPETLHQTSQSLKP